MNRSQKAMGRGPPRPRNSPALPLEQAHVAPRLCVPRLRSRRHQIALLRPRNVPALLLEEVNFKNAFACCGSARAATK